MLTDLIRYLDDVNDKTLYMSTPRTFIEMVYMYLLQDETEVQVPATRVTGRLC